VETLLQNKTINTFENETSREPSPFYTKNDQMFYKNKLISVEEVFSASDSSHNEDKNMQKHFNTYDSAISYILTFEDEYGNTHSHISRMKPKNIGDIFYYVTECGNLSYLTHESDKESLKEFIDLYFESYNEYKGFRFKAADIFTRHFSSISLFCLSLCVISIIGMIAGMITDGGIMILLSSLLWFTSFLTFQIMKISTIRSDKEIKKLISDKKDEILKSFL